MDHGKGDKMTVIVLDYSDGSVHFEDVKTESDLWEMGFKESEISWMTLEDTSVVYKALCNYIHKEG